MRTAIWEVAINAKDQLRKDKGKDSLLKSWTESNKKLFKILSAKGFKEKGLRKLTPFSARLTKTKGIHRACQLVQEEARERHWSGDILKGALAKFLSQGFRASDITRSPGGLTVFMSAPLGFEQEVSKEQIAQRLRETFGDEKLGDELVKEYSSDRFYLPKSVDEARQQLAVIVDFLDCLTGYKSVASETYSYGADYLKRHARRAIQAAAGDSLFPTKFLYLLDCVFQNFCSKMTRYSTYKDPLREARRDDMDRYVRKELDSALSDFERTGSTLNLQLPMILQPKKGISPKAKVTNPNEEKGSPVRKEKEEPWHRENPDKVAEWQLPADKKFGDYFKRGGANVKKLPKLHHHSSGNVVPLCLHYQLRGTCSKGKACRMAHVPRSRMSQDDYEKVDQGFKAIYAGGS